MNVPGRLSAVFVALACVALGSAAISEPQTSQQAGAEGGLYTELQSNHGATAYMAYCASCHGASLTGGTAPPLTGPFWSSWDKRSLGELYQLIQGSMPQDAPSSLSDAEYAAILAFMLKEGGYPVGQVELPAAPEKLSSVMIGPPR